MNEYYSEKFKSVAKRKTVVFIDAANLERSVQDIWVNPKEIPDEYKKYTVDNLSWRINYIRLKEFFTKTTDLKKIVFYSARFDSLNHDKFLVFLKKNNFQLKTKPLKEYNDHTVSHPHRKANFDVEIAVDATFFIPDYDTFILFSGDCDFEYLLKFLCGQNKITVVFSRKGHIAKELPPASNYYFDIIDFRNVFLEIKPKKAKNPA